MAKYVDPGMRPSDKWIPWYFVAFFVVVFIVNGIFVYIATTSQPGVIEENHYEIGLAYDERIAEERSEKALGWQSDVRFDGDKAFSVSMVDKDGNALQGASVKVEMIREVQDGHDFEAILSETAPGQYSADIDFPLPGQWDAYIYVTWNDKLYHIKKMIVAKP